MKKNIGRRRLSEKEKNPVANRVRDRFIKSGS